MTDSTQSMRQDAKRAPLLGPFLLAATLMGLIALRAVVLRDDPLTLLATGDNDDILRLMSVRAWLDGQSWFDMTQSRVLPPDGLSLHWSRYVDAGIAAVIGLASLILPPPQAEAAALVWWPSLLLIALMALTWRLGRKALGPWPAALAVLSLAAWPMIAQSYFAPARLDHHNVQILLMSLVVLTLIQPRPSAVLGAVAGLSAALSLAVGLEMLIPIALAGLILCARTLATPRPEAPMLMAFGTALGLGALAFHLGQTAPAEWAVAQCDRLSLPFLGIALGATGVTLVVGLTAPRLPRIAQRAGVLGAATAAVLLALSPLLAPCLAGPYGDLPPEVQTLIFEGIREAMPLSHFIQTANSLAFTVALPIAGALGTASAVWLVRARTGRTRPHEGRALRVLLAFAALGMIGAIFQIRLALLAAPAVPLLTGYALAKLGQIRRHARARSLPSLALVGALAVTLAAPLFYLVIPQGPRPTAQAADLAPGPQTCRRPDSLAALQDLPQGRVLAPGSLSTSILLLTPHDVLAAPYHRSAAGIANGVLPFQRTPSDLPPALVALQADYLVLCRDTPFGAQTGAQALLDGASLPGITPLPLAQTSPLAVYRVTRP